MPNLYGREYVASIEVTTGLCRGAWNGLEVPLASESTCLVDTVETGTIRGAIRTDSLEFSGITVPPSFFESTWWRPLEIRLDWSGAPNNYYGLIIDSAGYAPSSFSLNPFIAVYENVTLPSLSLACTSDSQVRITVTRGRATPVDCKPWPIFQVNAGVITKRPCSGGPAFNNPAMCNDLSGEHTLEYMPFGHPFSGAVWAGRACIPGVFASWLLGRGGTIQVGTDPKRVSLYPGGIIGFNGGFSSTGIRYVPSGPDLIRFDSQPQTFVKASDWNDANDACCNMPQSVTVVRVQ